VVKKEVKMEEKIMDKIEKVEKKVEDEVKGIMEKIELSVRKAVGLKDKEIVKEDIVEEKDDYLNLMPKKEEEK